MARISGKNTGPEIAVRSLIHKLGYRFRLYSKDLPGRPDLVFAGRKKAIFVHGCFWHGHKGCAKGKLPKSNLDYWKPKLKRNKNRDAENRRLLESRGWSVLVLWQCELKNEGALKDRIIEFLET
jgi:DNA mismatch endonuclease (patch repair protein)